MFGMGAGLPPQKANDFNGSLRRLFGQLRPEAPKIVVVILLAVISVFFAVIGPKILSNAINLIFEGAISKQLPAGTTQAQVIAGLQAQGQDQTASMLSTMTLTPGSGIDFGQLATILGIMAGVATTLNLYRAGRAVAEIPVWQAIAQPVEALRDRAARIADAAGVYEAQGQTCT